MITLIITFLTNALVIMGIYHAFSDGQILGKVRKWLLTIGNPERTIFCLKPIFLCFVCMPTVWGTIGYLVYLDFSIFHLPIYVLALSGFMFLIKLYFYES